MPLFCFRTITVYNWVKINKLTMGKQFINVMCETTQAWATTATGTIREAAPTGTSVQCRARGRCRSSRGRLWPPRTSSPIAHPPPGWRSRTPGRSTRGPRGLHPSPTFPLLTRPRPPRPRRTTQPRTWAAARATRPCLRPPRGRAAWRWPTAARARWRPRCPWRRDVLRGCSRGRHESMKTILPKNQLFPPKSFIRYASTW